MLPIVYSDWLRMGWMGNWGMLCNMWQRHKDEHPYKISWRTKWRKLHWPTYRNWRMSLAGVSRSLFIFFLPSLSLSLSLATLLKFKILFIVYWTMLPIIYSNSLRMGWMGNWGVLGNMWHRYKGEQPHKISWRTKWGNMHWPTYRNWRM